MAHDIFISYSTKDKAMADAVCAYMENGGLRCWYAPRDIRPGADWADSIIKAIEGSRVMILIFTKDSNVSKQVMREVDYAVHVGVTIVPIRLSNEKPAESMRYYLAGLHWLDAVGKEEQEAISQLYDLCSAVIGKSPLDAVAIDGVRDMPLGAKPDEGFADDAGMANKEALGTNKKWIALILIAVLVIAGAAGAVLYFRSSGSEENNEDGKHYESGVETKGVDLSSNESYTSGNTQSNLINGGYMAYDGKWYYYGTANGLFRMNEDGGEKTRLSDRSAWCISVYGGFVYFASGSFSNSSEGKPACIMRIKADGSESSEEVLRETDVTFMCIINDRIYYKELGDWDASYLGSLCSMNLDGSDFREETDLSNAVYFCMDNEYIYYTDMNYGNYICRMKYDGSGNIRLLDREAEELTICGNHLFFNDYDEQQLSWYDISSGKAESISADKVSYINCDGTYIYGNITDDSQDHEFIMQELSGGNRHVLLKEDVLQSCVCGNKIYCLRNGKTPLIMNIDGSDRIEL